MSNTARLQRLKAPKKLFANHKKAKRFLLFETGNRCSYSMQHMDHAGGYKSMDVDHFHPNAPSRNRYENLLVASRHCNGAKSNQWPTTLQKRAGCYIINPYREIDYGVHLFEDPESHLLVGATPAGIYHIEVLDLNAPHLVKERAARSRIQARLTASAQVKGSFEEFGNCVRELANLKKDYIPDIPAPPLK